MSRHLACWIAAVAVAVAAAYGPARPARAQDEFVSEELADLSLEELMSIEVYSVAKKSQRLSDSAAAAYVLTNEDIRRSGVTTVPDALRLVPGVEVARISSNVWAITIRGFNERFANKLLVMIDGRSVYTPFFAGTYWDIQDVVLEDIDRIEVIRGPGGTMWGANAVNGVINILTKSAKDTQGALLSGGAGTEEEAFGTARYGAKVAENAYVRVFGKYFQRDDFESTLAGNEGESASDEWHLTHGGFRMDWDPSGSDALTLQGDVYEGEVGTFTEFAQPPPDFVGALAHHANLTGGNVLGRWTHTFDGGSETQLQAYYDRTDRDSRPPTTNESRNTVELDFQHRLQVGEHHDVVWGLGYRITWDDIPGSFVISLDPQKRTVDLFSAFAQDEISLLDDSLRLTLGAKLEHNDFTGVEVQPNVRALWKAAEHHTFWGAVSRAVRTPSRAEDDIEINAQVIPAGMPGTPCELSPVPCVVSLRGDRSFDVEELVAFEAGYRTQIRDNVGFDVAAFYNLYDDVRSALPGDPVTEPGPPPLVFIPVAAANGLEVDTWGVEIAADWRPVEHWTLRSGYTFLEMDLDFEDGHQPSGFVDHSSPHNQVFVRSLLDLPAGFELDANFKWVDELDAFDVGDYANLDLRVGWRPNDTLELSLVGRNLLHDSNQEFVASEFVADEATKVERGVYGKVTLRF